MRGGSIPTEFIPAVEKGFRALLAKGRLIGFPVIGVRVVVNDGQSHAVDSSDIAFQAAARGAFREVYPRAKPIILEPIMKLAVEGPAEFQGAMLKTIMQRRGTVIGTTEEEGFCRVEAEVPLAEMFGYATDLRSATQGKAEFTHGVRALPAGAGARCRRSSWRSTPTRHQGSRKSDDVRGSAYLIPHARSPLRLLEKGLHGGLGAGNLGAACSPAHGVGKTRLPGRRRARRAAARRPVLHVSLDQNVDHVRDYYDTVFEELAALDPSRGRAPTCTPRSTAGAASAPTRRPASTQALREAVKLETEAGARPELVVVEGFDVAQRAARRWRSWRRRSPASSTPRSGSRPRAAERARARSSPAACARSATRFA